VLGEDDTLHRLRRAGDARVRLEPLDDNLLVEPTDEDHETRAGLIIPASNEVIVRSGIVLAVGDDPDGVAPGDKIVFPKAAAVEVRVSGEPVLLVRRRDVIARYAE
jgi:chaperonin GroES